VEVQIDETNRHFSFSEPFLLNFEGLLIVRCMGSPAAVEIPNRIQKLCRCSFQACELLTRVTFEANSELSVIDEHAFTDSGLDSISIPSSVVRIGPKCFSYCDKLKVIAFETGSKLADSGNDICDESHNVERIEVPEAILWVCKRGFASEVLQMDSSAVS
jgi:hypothetical protein